MEKITKKKITSWSFFWLAMDAFLGLGLEIVILLAEIQVYGQGLDKMNTWQNLLHWGLTCLAWGTMTFYLLNQSNKKYGFNIWENVAVPDKKNILIAGVLVLILIAQSALSWKGFKPYMEFQGKSVVLFIGQYIYYLFETAIFMLIVIFGQKFGEMAFKKQSIPWGGILLAITWASAHILTKNFQTGIESMFCALLYGIIYLLMKKNPKWSYVLIAISFMC